MNAKLKRGGILLLLMGMLASCTPPGPTPTATLPGESLEWEKIVQSPGVHSDWQHKGGPVLTIVANQEEIELLESVLYPELRVQLSNCDFSSHFVVAVFQGYRGILDYSVQIKDVRLRNDVIAVYAKFLEPNPKKVKKNITSSPYYVLKVKKTAELKGEFVFVLNANAEEIMRLTRFIP